MSQDCDTKLQTATREKLRKLNSLRGEWSFNGLHLLLYFNKGNFSCSVVLVEGRQVQPGEFWDVVVVTAVDESQREAYERQISEKVDRGELPLGTHYKVFSDPPGSKIGETDRQTDSLWDLI